MSTGSLKAVIAAGRTSEQLAFASRPTTEEQDLIHAPALVTAFPEEVSPDSTDLSQALADNMALLIVTKTMFEGLPAFQLYFHYRGVPQSATKDAQMQRQRPNLEISLAELTARDRQEHRMGHWRDAFGTVRNWWKGLYPLSSWLGRLVDADDDPRLIIWDETGYEIPWELFYRDPRTHAGGSAGRKGWLGELIPVVRWTAAASMAAPWEYTAQDRRCDGPLLVAEGIAAGDGETDPFVGYPVMARFGGLREMLIELGKDDYAKFGLAIVHGHGDYSEHAGEFALDRVPLNELDEYPLNALTRSGALVLLNACASGRPSGDPANHGSVPRSFVEVFLRSGAGGVIATAADIDLNQRHEFAIRLIESARTTDLQIAEALRSIRASYAVKAEKIRATRDKVDLERQKPRHQRTMTDEALAGLDQQVERVYKWFFAWFAYLYYGHPDTRLRIRMADQP